MKVFATIFVILFFCLSCSVIKHNQSPEKLIKINEKIAHPTVAPPATSIVFPIDAGPVESQTLRPFLYIVVGSIILCSSLSLLNLKKRIKKSAIN